MLIDSRSLEDARKALGILKTPVLAIAETSDIKEGSEENPFYFTFTECEEPDRFRVVVHKFREHFYLGVLYNSVLLLRVPTTCFQGSKSYLRFSEMVRELSRFYFKS